MMNKMTEMTTDNMYEKTMKSIGDIYKDNYQMSTKELFDRCDGLYDDE